jgi:hypothetical protein
VVSATAALAGGEKVAAITKVGVVTVPSARGAAAGGAMAGTFGLFRLPGGWSRLAVADIGDNEADAFGLFLLSGERPCPRFASVAGCR